MMTLPELPKRLPIYGDDNPESLIVVANIGVINNLIRAGHLDLVGAKLLVPAYQWEHLWGIENEGC